MKRIGRIQAGLVKGTTLAAAESTKSFSATCLAAAEKLKHLNERRKLSS
jgi:hypothetical protein